MVDGHSRDFFDFRKGQRNKLATLAAHIRPKRGKLIFFHTFASGGLSVFGMVFAAGGAVGVTSAVSFAGAIGIFVVHIFSPASVNTFSSHRFSTRSCSSVWNQCSHPSATVKRQFSFSAKAATSERGITASFSP